MMRNQICAEAWIVEKKKRWTWWVTFIISEK
jgi:hypothetical protein